MIDKEIMENTLTLHCKTIEELKELKRKVQRNCKNEVKFKIETKHWYGYREPLLLKESNQINLSNYAMCLIIDEAINKEREKIDNLINIKNEEEEKIDVNTTD